MSKSSITYSKSGVNYQNLDPIKKLAQNAARKTGINLKRNRFEEISDSRGESAFVWQQGKVLMASVIEGLGTKNLVADISKITGKSYYDIIGHDTVATIINDLITVGAKPLTINAYWAVGQSDWFKNTKRTKDLIRGWGNACNLAGVTWGGGETPTLKGIVQEESIDLAGSAVGIIKPKERLTLGDKLEHGDGIVLIESSGIHANGLTLARKIASKLPKGYETILPDGKTYGESLLTPTHIYAKLIEDLFNIGIDIHYMVNITGHGWRKLMRANRNFGYVIDVLPEPQPVFKFIQEQSKNDDKEMYGNFNMGAGFAIFVPEKDVDMVQQIAKEECGFKSTYAGTVVEGGNSKMVSIHPKGIVYKSETLGVR